MSKYSVSWCPRVVGGKWNGGECWDVVTPPVSLFGAHGVHASCPTRDAAEAARRLLSGECERDLEDARVIAELVEYDVALAKTGAVVMCTDCGDVCCGCYGSGLADGAAQEREKIVKWLRPAGKFWQGPMLADAIERGEAGE